MKIIGIFAVLCLLSFGCNGSGGEGDADGDDLEVVEAVEDDGMADPAEDEGEDIEEEEEIGECTPFPAPERGGDGADLAAPIPAGRAVAGRILNPAQVPPAVKSWAEVDDVLIRNDRVGFVIEDAGSGEGFRSHGFGPYAGEIVFADLWTGEGFSGEGLMGELMPTLNLQILDPDSVTVLHDGSDGDAVVRMTGTLRLMPFLDLAAGAMLRTEPFEGELFVDFILGADDAFLQVHYTIRNPLTEPAVIELPLVNSVMGDGLKFLTPELGFEVPTSVDEHDFIGFAGTNIGYAYVDGRGGRIRYVLERDNFLFTTLYSAIEIEPCGETAVHAFDFLVAHGGAEPLLRQVRLMRGASEPAGLSGTVTVAGSGPADGARVHVQRDDGSWAASALTSPGGGYSLSLEPGSYEVTAVLEGHRPSGPLSVTMTSSDAAQDLVIDQPGLLTWTVRDDAGEPVPAKIMVFPDAAPDPLPDSFGEPSFPGGAAAVVFDHDGSGDMVLPEGGYRVTASRGFFYEIDEEAFSVTAGSAVNLDLVLEKSVDASGFLCGDFHQHSTWSPDSDTPGPDVVAANMAEGLSLLVSTDHDWIVDFGGTVEAMSATGMIRAFAGEEITTFEYGHFNVFPMTVSESERNMGAVEHFYRPPADVFSDALADPLGPVLQLNHPRSEGVVGGYFNAVGLDPLACTQENPGLWSELWSLVEVFNFRDFRENEADGGTGTVEDWFGLLDCGKRFAATGNSDSHDPLTRELGYPRNCLLVGHDDPSAVGPEELKAALADLKVLVSGGPFIHLDAGGMTMGDLAPAPGGLITIDVRVQAPLWMAADRMRVFVSGTELAAVVLDETTADPGNPVIRFQDGIDVDTGGADGWVVVVVEGDATLDPVVGGRRPFAATNPLFLDGDGDGLFTP